MERENLITLIHQLKNDLTPVRLGLQVLQKSWENNDPEFGQKFAKIHPSLIEQVEKLNQLLTEASQPEH